MKIVRSIVTLACLATVLFSCKHQTQPVPHYAISKVFKTDTLTTVDVHIASRMPVGQMLLIAGKVRSDSAQLKNLAIHFLLPGNVDLSAGDNSYYAAAKFIKEGEVKSTDTLKDDNGNVLRLKQFGLDSISAQQLLTQQPPLLLNKTVLGRFIDDYDKTVIIPFKDPTDKADEIFVIEVDATGKILSATVPHKKVEDGQDKWLVSKNGDYITIKDSVLSQYAGNGLGLPFNSIRSGI